MSDWESVFSAWAKPPGTTEETKCQNAEKAIKNAIKASDKLKNRNIKVFSQGSYHNNTNVRKDSDVDIGVLCLDVFFTEYPEGTTDETFGIVDSGYKYPTFKDEVGQALIDYFGKAAVKRGNKAFDIKETTYHVEADVAPFFEHRWYDRNGNFISGVELRPDNKPLTGVVNFPEQHYNNGVNKNKDTGFRYKSIVRILKALSNHMANEGVAQAQNIMGFLVECMVWNVPNNYFGYSKWSADLRECLAFLFNNIKSNKDCAEWVEVNNIKYLFHTSQKWTREQAFNFIDAAWDFIGFE